MNNKIQEIKSKSYELMNYIDNRVYPFFASVDKDVYEELMRRVSDIDADIYKLEGMMLPKPLTLQQLFDLDRTESVFIEERNKGIVSETTAADALGSMRYYPSVGCKYAITNYGNAWRAWSSPEIKIGTAPSDELMALHHWDGGTKLESVSPLP